MFLKTRTANDAISKLHYNVPDEGKNTIAILAMDIRLAFINVCHITLISFGPADTVTKKTITKNPANKPVVAYSEGFTCKLLNKPLKLHWLVIY